MCWHVIFFYCDISIPWKTKHSHVLYTHRQYTYRTITVTIEHVYYNIHTARNCRTSCVWMCHYHSSKKQTKWANKQRKRLMYMIRKMLRFRINNPNNNVECCFNFWCMFGCVFSISLAFSHHNTTFPFGSRWFCVCWYSMTMRHLTSKIHIKYTNLVRKMKWKESAKMAR